ncbi:hypothetical protein BDV96DRAFT_357112 [Lophiotrema nucula]|uniref:SP-RING-type domain-containing protein n=1 Tax=Lophiotrema nucula TaxID=690887 RepID=A0A6A5YF03_9PLEO|nr:hypothetical protein BDV96DRAFT_357112 [Lophiotrema nucula]
MVRHATRLGGVDVAAGNEILDLTDRTSRIRIVKPVRGIDCEHLQCFDLDIFLDRHCAVHGNDHNIRCPLCDYPMHLSDLRNDRYFESILSGANATEADKAKINSDGTWSLLYPAEPSNVTCTDNEGENGDRKKGKVAVKVSAALRYTTVFGKRGTTPAQAKGKRMPAGQPFKLVRVKKLRYELHGANKIPQNKEQSRITRSAQPGDIWSSRLGGFAGRDWWVLGIPPEPDEEGEDDSSQYSERSSGEDTEDDSDAEVRSGEPVEDASEARKSQMIYRCRAPSPEDQSTRTGFRR